MLFEAVPKCSKVLKVLKIIRRRHALDSMSIAEGTLARMGRGYKQIWSDAATEPRT